MPVTRDYLDKFRKTPTAIETIAVDFRDRIPSNESPSDHSVWVEDEDGNLVTGTLILTTDRRGSRVIAALKDGVANKDYYAHFKLICTTSQPEATIKVEVRP